MNPPVRVKICGITNAGDAIAAIDAGADALGFNLYPGSKRHVRLEEVRPWVESLGTRVLRVAVMVDPSMAQVHEAQQVFDAIQLHGDESAAFCAEATVGGKIWKAFPLTPSLDPAEAAAFEAHAILIDSSDPGGFGGTGTLIDLDAAARFVRACGDREVWLSGGLNPENVAAAVEKVLPYGVDVASGVEAAGIPRRKDPGLVRAFIKAAKGL